MSTDDVVGPRLRAVLSAIPRYVPGRPAAETAHKISSNENPYPPLPSVLEAVARAARSLNRYPDMACLRLVEAIAHRLPAWIRARTVVGPGSSIRAWSSHHRQVWRCRSPVS